MTAWARLLLEFEATAPTDDQRAAFGRACHDSSHLPVDERVALLRRTFGLALG